jgi:predicted glycosyltransferase
LINNYEHLPLKSNNIITYDGYHELAYLHPSRFSPDENIFSILNLDKNEPYIIIRFVSWDASHDIGQKGFSLAQKEKIIKTLSKKIKLFVSSENELPENLKSYKIKIPPERMHDALAFATLFIGEGSTMATECAILGTPSIYINSLEPLYIKEQENYGLLFNYRKGDGILEKALDLLKDNKLKGEFYKRRNKMLSEKIDLTAFTVWFVENYPKSLEITKRDPSYQKRFR